ncbi:hypothetical protein [Parvibaculum sp.]|uniref:hypothetical protein n=1 Tax=Parvibaculum sp. TaxID=2024848 RepID=UPI0027349D62|nr:hypothetical protein [Parvibaculum sp.]MDP3327215.1 hypothetical protein [Parvibaculum sp.]
MHNPFRFEDYSRAPNGLFSLDVFRHGKLIEHFEDKNLIVNGSKAVNARLIGGDVTNRSITQIGFGTSGTAPAGGNTVLTSAYTKAVDAVTYPVEGTVQFAFSLGTGEANGKAILEFGLFTAAGTLYARKVRSAALNKESDISLLGTWQITF